MRQNKKKNPYVKQDCQDYQCPCVQGGITLLFITFKNYYYYVVTLRGVVYSSEGRNPCLQIDNFPVAGWGSEA